MDKQTADKFRAKVIDIDVGKSILLMHEIDARRMSVHMGDRVLVNKCLRRGETGRCGNVALIDISDTMVSEGEVGFFNDLAAEMRISPRTTVYVSPWGKPESVTYIRKKIDGKELSPQEISKIINDIVEDRLSEIEMSAYVTASAIHGFTKGETVALTWAMVNTGDRLDFEGITVDKHCVGGVPGNRTTLLGVPILAALGLKIPKTSSRAITSPAGTADTMEVLAPVSYGAKDVKRFVEKINGCIVWGGSINLAPADDKIIKIEYPLSIDAEGQVLASIMSKKKSVGSDFVLIDIPWGAGSKMPEEARAKELGEKFVDLGSEIEMNVRYVLTDGTKPIGDGIGPVLEARDVLRALSGDGPQDLVDKSIFLVGELLEFSGSMRLGEGQKEARRCLEDGRALEKMRQIIKMQKGNPVVKPEDLKPGRYNREVICESGGKVIGIDNSLIAKIAREAGAPRDPAAGIYLEKHVGETAGAGETLFTIYSENQNKLSYACGMLKDKSPFSIV